jgi:hypothetical protein
MRCELQPLTPLLYLVGAFLPVHRSRHRDALTPLSATRRFARISLDDATDFVGQFQF